MEKKQIRSYFITNYLDTESNFYDELHVPFQVSRMEVMAQLTVETAGPPAAPIEIYNILTSNIVGGDLALTCCGTNAIYTFTNPITVNGLYNFSVHRADESLNDDAEKRILIHFTFYE